MNRSKSYVLGGRVVRNVALQLGAEYLVHWENPWTNVWQTYHVRVIKPTKCGYNLLILNQHRCFLRKHLYLNKKLSKGGETVLP